MGVVSSESELGNWVGSERVCVCVRVRVRVCERALVLGRSGC